MYIIKAKRWFDKRAGNTYHSVRVYVDNKLVAHVPFSYGYDDRYKYTARDALKAAGYIDFDSDKEVFWETMVRCGGRDNWLIFCDDVQRKKDL